MKPKPPQTLPIHYCEQPSDWLDWLEENHAASPGVWLQLAKNGGNAGSLTYAQAVEAALCFGWIDG